MDNSQLTIPIKRVDKLTVADYFFEHLVNGDLFYAFERYSTQNKILSNSDQTKH